MTAGAKHQLDVAALHGALDTVRRFRGISWKQIAAETGVGQSSFTRLGQGQTVDADALVALLVWLGHTEGLGKFIVRSGQ